MGERTLSFVRVEGLCSGAREAGNLLFQEWAPKVDAAGWSGSGYLGDFRGRGSLLAPLESKSICFKASS